MNGGEERRGIIVGGVSCNVGMVSMSGVRSADDISVGITVMVTGPGMEDLVLSMTVGNLDSACVPNGKHIVPKIWIPVLKYVGTFATVGPTAVVIWRTEQINEFLTRRRALDVRKVPAKTDLHEDDVGQTEDAQSDQEDSEQYQPLGGSGKLGNLHSRSNLF